LPTALFVPSLAIYASMRSSVPTGTEFFVTPMRINWFGLPPSIIHVVTLPSASLTSTWNHECGLIISHFTSVPLSFSGLFTSNSAEKAWCAPSGTPTNSIPTPTTIAASLVRMWDPLLNVTTACTPCRISTGLVRALFRRGFSGPLLQCARVGQHVHDRVVALVAGMLEERPLRIHPLEGHFGGKGPRPRLRVVDRETVVDS